MADVEIVYLKSSKEYTRPETIKKGADPINFSAEPGSMVHDFQIAPYFPETSGLALFSGEKCSPLVVVPRGHQERISLSGVECQINVLIDNRSSVQRFVEDKIGGLFKSHS